MNRRTFARGAASLLVATPLTPNRIRAGEYRPLICRASVDRQNIDYNEAFELTALLEWVEGDGRVFVPLTWGLRGFQVSTSDTNATFRNPPINNFHPPPLQALNDPAWFIHMSRGAIVGEKGSFRAREFFPEPGTFTIFVGYLSPVPREFTHLVRAVVTEDGVFNAPPISVTVT